MIFIHLGYPKTGTTYLQRCIFDNINEIKYLGKPHSINFRNFFPLLLKYDDEEFIKEKKNLANMFASEIKNLGFNIKTKSHLSLLISNETLLDANSYGEKNYSFEKIINRLNEILKPFDELSYIFVIRKYKDILISYLREINKKKKINFKKIVFFLNENKFLLNNFLYAQKINTLKKLSLNYKVLIYEEMQQNKDSFYKELSLFLRLNISINSNLISKKRLNETLEINKYFGFYNLIINLKHFIKVRRHRILPNIFNLNKYIYTLKMIKSLIRKNISLQNTDVIDSHLTNELMINFFKEDLNNLPEDIKKKCIFYNYLK